MDKSLVSPDEVGEGEPRFALLETVREYALEQLRQSGEPPAVRRRHARYSLGLAEAAEPHRRTADREVWLRRLDGDEDNLRAALGVGDARAGPLDRRLAAARAGLDGEAAGAFDAGLAAGQSVPLSRAIAEALAEPAPPARPGGAP